MAHRVQEGEWQVWKRVRGVPGRWRRKRYRDRRRARRGQSPEAQEARNFKGVGWGCQQNKMPQSHQFSQIWKVCVELGGHTWNIWQTHMRKPILRMSKCLIYVETGPGRGLPSRTFYSVSFILWDWLFSYDLFSVLHYRGHMFSFFII